MEGSTGTLFNHDHPNGVGVTVQEVNRENQDITFYMDPDGDELNLKRNNEQQVRNDEELQANHDKYFVDWIIHMENEPPNAVNIPGEPEGNNPNVSNNDNDNNDNPYNNGAAHGIGGRRKKRKTRMRKTRRLRKAKKTRRHRK